MEITINTLEAIFKDRYKSFVKLTLLNEMDYSHEISYNFVAFITEADFIMFQLKRHPREKEIREVKYDRYWLDRYDNKPIIVKKDDKLNSTDKFFSQFIGEKININNKG